MTAAAARGRSSEAARALARGQAGAQAQALGRLRPGLPIEVAPKIESDGERRVRLVLE